MKQRRRIYYSAAQRSEIWDRWQVGDRRLATMTSAAPDANVGLVEPGTAILDLADVVAEQPAAGAPAVLTSTPSLQVDLI